VGGSGQRLAAEREDILPARHHDEEVSMTSEVKAFVITRS
jgi:hypothetical protein